MKTYYQYYTSSYKIQGFLHFTVVTEQQVGKSNAVAKLEKKCLFRMKAPRKLGLPRLC